MGLRGNGIGAKRAPARRYPRPVTAPRVRFAPAPTGYLHVGSARTALFNWLFARGRGGAVVLRIEDTDASLRAQEYVDAIVEPLGWLGIDWDEGPHFQSERGGLYAAAIDSLVASGAAYYCDLTGPEIEARAAEAGLPGGYHGWSRDRGVKDGPGAVVRFRSPDSGATEVRDLIRGRVSFPNSTLEDFVIRRGDGTATFLLANAVDDHDMGISHVIRGEDLLNATPKVKLLWEALGYGPPPAYAHLPLLVNEKRQKLAKRRDDVSLGHYREQGYLPEAMANYLALLGWGPPDKTEIRPLAEIVGLFDLEAVIKSPAFFDPRKLDHVNAAYLRALSPDELVERAEPFVRSLFGPGRRAGRYDPEVVRTLAPEIGPRVSKLGEVAGWVGWIMADEVDYDPKSWQKAMVKGRAAAEVLDLVSERLAGDDFSSADRLESIVMGAGDEIGARLGARVLSQAPVRVALSGSNVGLPLWEPMRLLGRDETLSRLGRARARLAEPGGGEDGKT